MATIHPRVQVCLDPKIKAVYDDAAKAMNIPTSRLIANICVDAAPNIVQLTEMLNEAKSKASPVAFLNMAKDLATDARQVLSDAQFDIEDAISRSKASAEPKIKSKANPKAKPKPKA